MGNFIDQLPNLYKQPMKENPSDAIPQCGIELIKTFEGYREDAYADPIHGWAVPTIGYGTIKYPDGRQVQQGDTIIPERAEQYLISHIATECTSTLEKIPTWGRMNANQRGALYSFAYNLGAAFYKDPDFQSITKVCDSSDQWHDFAWVEAQFVKYCNPGTDAEEGLRRRRREEAKLFCTSQG
ncbi:MAG: lysozyme [Leptolyngbyaceae cyanobacterium CAN_BIN12]|nr:lysozyme [Leptolyngbyaceae cyanobacterium CAN_BIN12]